MNPTDDDLVLYHYRDGLEPARAAAIERALATDPALRARLAALEATLAAVDAEPLREPDARFEDRLWSRIAPRIATAPRERPAGGFREALRALFAPRPAFAFAMLVLAVALGYTLGRHATPTPQPPQVAQQRQQQPAIADRVLAAYVAKHLASTESLLLTAANSDDSALAEGNRELAAALVDSNRLYAAAAARQGNARLAEFLRKLEPLLIDLANQPSGTSIGSGAGLRDYLDRTDLLFEVRATKARIDPAGLHRA